jgi:type I restriction enzyme, R subunit
LNLPDSPNFSYLRAYDEQLVRLGNLAERYFKDDPSTALIKLRQFGEVLAQITAAKAGLYTDAQEQQSDLLRRLKIERVLPDQAADLFHQLRMVGNKATHQNVGTRGDVLSALKVARVLGIWFHRTMGHDKSFSPGPFVPPADPDEKNQELADELERLRKELDNSRNDAEKAKIEAAEKAKRLLSAEEIAKQKAQESEVWEKLAAAEESNRIAVEKQLAAMQAAAQNAPAQTAAIPQAAQEAATKIELDEAATRAIIDQHLIIRGWEADSVNLRHNKGARPVKGQNRAIAEWPTASGPADYALFIGVKCVGVIEAKRQRKNVSAAIDQAERYAKTINKTSEFETVGGPWNEYKIPFVFATNGRAYLKQIETESGIWFRDVRLATNHRRALADWPTPDGLLAQTRMDRAEAEESLKQQTFDFGFPLRPYQKKAIEKVENALENDRRQMLLAMATGTGKTKLAIAMLYRLLTAKRFRRVCFVVDRSALGRQTAAEFETTKVVSVRTFADTFGIKKLANIEPDTETKVHICTIQGLLKRVLYAKSPADVPPVDQYDLMVIDECHRGYTLDRELSDVELQFRSQDDYISKYRRVLEHFDAVKIGLTATPALHTVEIFGDPIHTYSYREAVVDGYLIDHDPPLQIETELSRNSIKFEQGEEMEILNTSTGTVDLTHAPDEITFDVDDFNKKVVTVPFNKAVCEALAQSIDPNFPGKTLVFASSDAHADIVVDQLKKAFEKVYGEVEDEAIKKITGSVDRVQELILSYRNDSFPKIAVTVDLLTTGIDVPQITNLVFLRRVNSRILYEQMLGRATRQCPEIGKTVFQIFDPVGLYRNLESLTNMKPVVVDPSVSFTQLLNELETVEFEEQRKAILEQIVVKLRRRIKQLDEKIITGLTAETGESPASMLTRFHSSMPEEIKNWLKDKPKVGPLLDWRSDTNNGLQLPVSHHPDALISITHGYGHGEKPEDFLDSFTAFIKNNINEIMALTIVIQRPRELTRAQLRELRLELDKKGFSDANLRTAWHSAKNQDIAASIIGYIRQAALGDPLVPYEQRVKLALDRILARKSWTNVQTKWLKRIGEQLNKEIVVDQETLDSGQFQVEAGGFARLNKIFDGELKSVLADLNEEVWKTGT